MTTGKISGRKGRCRKREMMTSDQACIGWRNSIKRADPKHQQLRSGVSYGGYHHLATH